MNDLSAQRKFFSEEIQMAANLKSSAVVDALASVPRERFLPPGPWTVRSETDLMGPPRFTADADPRHVYHNVSIAIDPSRTLFNGAPSLLAMAIDALELRRGARVLHLGTGTGYYTAVMGHCVGADGRVLGIEVDRDLAAAARENLAPMPWVEVRHDDGVAPFDETFDAMLINAGVTHPQDGWLAALVPGGHLILPLTASMPGMGTIGKGVLIDLSRRADPDGFDARVLTFVAIYSALRLRDETLNAEVGKALSKQPFPRLISLRRDVHDPGPSCWLHTPAFCLTLEPAAPARPSSALV
jgi:protein-L-isoaspartate(D-aspartate) O-methyltransferase